MKQKTLFRLSHFSSEFGGQLSPGVRKTSRPISNKNALHIVLRGSIQRSGSLLKHRQEIDRSFYKFAAQFGVRIYEKAIVSNHIHFVALFSSRQQYVKFIRALTGTIALKTKIIWTLRPWSRILSWGRGFKVAIRYVVQNHLEATGLVPYRPRHTLFKIAFRSRVGR